MVDAGYLCIGICLILMGLLALYLKGETRTQEEQILDLVSQWEEDNGQTD